MEEGFEYDYDLPSLSEAQKEQNKKLIKEIVIAESPELVITDDSAE